MTGRGSGDRVWERTKLMASECSDGKMRSLRKRTQGRSAAIRQRRVPRCVHEEIEAGYTEVPRTNRRKKAAPAWTLKVKLGHDSRPPAQGLSGSRRPGGVFWRPIT